MPNAVLFAAESTSHTCGCRCTTSAPETTTTLTSTTTALDEKGACTMWGDPHIRTFDDRTSSFYESGTYPVVSSSRISIQARYERIDFSPNQKADGWLTSLNVSGPFLEGHTLSFRAGSDMGGDGGLFWDEVALFQGPEHEVSLGSGLVLATRQDNPVRSWQRLEPTDARRNAQSPGRLIRSYDVTLPLDVVLTVNVVDWGPRHNLDMLLMMYPEPEGQSGHCGNFNGDKGDDVMTRMVSEEAATEDLAREAECTGEAYANATATCRAMCGDAQEDAFEEACIFDVCRAGPDVAISDCLIAWQTKVAKTPAISNATRLVGPGCCRAVTLLDRNHAQNQDVTLSECALRCASTDCTAFAVSGCSSTSDAVCGGHCHLYLSNDQQHITTGNCYDSALDDNTFCYAIE